MPEGVSHNKITVDSGEIGPTSNMADEDEAPKTTYEWQDGERETTEWLSEQDCKCRLLKRGHVCVAALRRLGSHTLYCSILPVLFLLALLVAITRIYSHRVKITYPNGDEYVGAVMNSKSATRRHLHDCTARRRGRCR